MVKIKDKETIKGSKEEATSYMQRNSHKAIPVDFSIETVQARRSNIFKVVKRKNLQPRILTLSSKPFIQISRSFKDKQNEDFSITKLAL